MHAQSTNFAKQWATSWFDFHAHSTDFAQVLVHKTSCMLLQQIDEIITLKFTAPEISKFAIHQTLILYNFVSSGLGLATACNCLAIAMPLFGHPHMVNFLVANIVAL